MTVIKNQDQVCCICANIYLTIYAKKDHIIKNRETYSGANWTGITMMNLSDKQDNIVHVFICPIII
jgi:hypothetical protein